MTTPYDDLPIEVRRANWGWFGEPYWSYACYDEAGKLLEDMRKPFPAGESCLHCGEPFDEGAGDSGQERARLGGERGRGLGDPPGPERGHGLLELRPPVGVGDLLLGRDPRAHPPALGPVRVVVPVDAILLPEQLLHLPAVQPVEPPVGEMRLRRHGDGVPHRVPLPPDEVVRDLHRVRDGEHSRVEHGAAVRDGQLGARRRLVVELRRGDPGRDRRHLLHDPAEPRLRVHRPEVGQQHRDLVGLDVGEDRAGHLRAQRRGGRVHRGHERGVERARRPAQVGVRGAHVRPDDRVGAAREGGARRRLVLLHPVAECGPVGGHG